MKIGTVAHISGHITKEKPWNSRSTILRKVEYQEPKQVLILGKSKRVTGSINFGNNWDDPGYFIAEHIFDVWMVMEIDKNNRYRTPLAVFEEQIVMEKLGEK